METRDKGQGMRLKERSALNSNENKKGCAYEGVCVCVWCVCM